MDDRARWDAKYAGAEGRAERPPDPFVVEALARLTPRPGDVALDVAAGTGRHATHLARRGWSVEAWDVSPVGLRVALDRAVARGLPLATRAVDVLAPPFVGPPEPVALVVLVDFLDRPLLERVAAWVRPGGHVLLRTFTLDFPGPKPPPRFRLRPGELDAGLPGLVTLVHDEAEGRAGVLARRDA